MKKAKVVLLCAAILATVFGHTAFGADKVRLWPDNLFGVDFVSPSIGYVTGYAGSLLRTRDGGLTWEWSHVGEDELFRRVSFVDEKQGWIAGHRGTILHTDNGGDSWKVQHRLPGVYLRDTAFADSDHGWAVGHDATILSTDDGGASWHPQVLTGYKGRDLPHLHGISAISAQSAILVGEFGVVAITNNGGSTWIVQETGIDETLLEVVHSNEVEAIAAGLDGMLLAITIKPQAKGLSSNTPLVATSIIESLTTEPFFTVATAGRGRILAAGRSVVALVEDGGVTHLEPDSSIQLPFVWYGGAEVIGDDQFWLVGIRGSIVSGSLHKNSFSSAANLGVSGNVTFAPKGVSQ